MLYILYGMNSFTICQQNDNQQKMKFFNKNIKACEENKKNFEENKKKLKEKTESHVSDIINGKTNHPKIIKYFIKKYQEDVIDVLLWFNEPREDAENNAQYKDEKEALKDLREDAQRIKQEIQQFPYARTAHLCELEQYHNQTPACKNLAHAYDSFKSYSQGIPELRKIDSVNRQINIHSDDKHTVAFLEKAKKRLQEDLKKIDAPLFNSLKQSGTEYSPRHSPSYFESLSEENQKILILAIENTVFEKITNFNELAEEFQSILYVFHEKAAYKYLNEKEDLKELRDDAERINKEKGNWGGYYASTIHVCELEWSKTVECKQLAQEYNKLRSYSSMHEIKQIKSIQKQINGKKSHEPVVAFLTEEKEKWEQKVKNRNGGHIPTNISSYVESRSEEDKNKLNNIIKNVVRKKTNGTEKLAEEFEKIYNVFNEKL